MILTIFGARKVSSVLAYYKAGMCLPHLKESTVAEENFFSRIPSQYAECVAACVKYVTIKKVRWEKLK